jgi:hypothetical protein
MHVESAPGKSKSQISLANSLVRGNGVVPESGLSFIVPRLTRVGRRSERQLSLPEMIRVIEL